MSRSNNSGKIVRTKTGKVGRTYNRDDLYNGKVKVYLEKEDEAEGKTYSTAGMLCDPPIVEEIIKVEEIEDTQVNH